MSRERAEAILANAELVHPAEVVSVAVDRLAVEITTALAAEFPVVLAIEVTRSRNGTAGRDIEWRLAPREDVAGRTVLVIDDILDEGITLAAVRDKLLAQGVRRVLTAVLADKALGRAKPIAADFVGVSVPDRYVFGFGMDAYGLWRNLPAIYALGN